MPFFVTPQAAKKRAVGRLHATKSEIEAATRARWLQTIGDLEALLRKPLPSGERARPRSEWENAFDALAVAHAAWDAPAVAMARAFAQEARADRSTQGVAEGRVA